MSLCISNFKITLETKPIPIKNITKIPKITIKQKVFIFNYKNFKCTVYNNKSVTNKINVTGIRSINELKILIKYLKKLKIETIKFNVDNTTCKLTFNKCINLNETAKSIFNRKRKYSYNKDKFAGLFYYKSKKNEGTCIIFQNGKIIILGCNSPQNIKEKCQDLMQIVVFA